MNRLFDELRRRKVTRVVIAYAAAAFVVLQVADIVLPPLGAPDWVMAAIVVVTALGLPVATALAWAFDVTPAGLVRTPESSADAATVGATGAAPAKRLDRRAFALVAGVAIVSLGAGAAILRARYIPDPALDQDLVAVLPFRVSGDPALDYLREGMVDLFTATLTGDGGPRAADPRLVLGAVERIARRENAELSADSAKLVGRAVGAGRVLVGSVVGTPGEILINASLVRVSGTARVIEASERGPAEQLTSLIDRVTAQLLSVDAGETDQRLATLTSTSLPALRAYLAGQRAYRRSRFADAAQRFDEAVVHDSTFALAALFLNTMSGWGNTGTPNQPRSARLAWQHRDRLSAPDRVLLDARIGPEYPAPRTVAQRITDMERALATLGERADIVFLYGDLLLHSGGLADHADHFEAAKQAFNRTLAIDSSFTPALTHLLDDAIATQDTAEAQRLFRLLERTDTSHEAATYQYWIRSMFLADSARLQQLIQSMDTIALADLNYIRLSAFFAALPPGLALRAAEVAVTKSLTPAERRAALLNAYRLALNLGRPADAAAHARQAMRTAGGNELFWSTLNLLDALFWDADTAMAVRAADRLSALMPAPTDTLNAPQREAACAGGIWHASRGEAPRAREYLRNLEPRGQRTTLLAELCVLTVQAVIAHQAGDATAAALLQRADSIASLGPPGPAHTLRALNFAIARLHELRGSPADALRGVRRHVMDIAGEMQYSTALREEGRLAERVGDRAAAILAYQRFLRIRSESEPSLQHQVAEAHAALTRLRGADAR